MMPHPYRMWSRGGWDFHSILSVRRRLDRSRVNSNLLILAGREMIMTHAFVLRSSVAIADTNHRVIHWVLDSQKLESESIGGS